MTPAISSGHSVGRVYLVGGGPGDPGLLTLRGLECLRRADLILYDGLVNPLLLRHTHAKAERTSRATGPQGRRIDQEEINRRLVDAALAGKTVVRLKGGDPFVFGRGSEEAAALSAAGIPFEVVPGITAATGAAVYAGISLTHRDHASAVAFITGHEDPTKPASALDYHVLADFPGTLVFYMGLHRLAAICQRLIEAGKPASTPAAVVCKATTPFQRTVVGTLADLPQRAGDAGLHPPSLLIVGECVQVRNHAEWFEQRPLRGQTIAILRPEEQADSVVDQIVEQGGQPLVIPIIEITPPSDWSAVDAVLNRLAEFDWLVFTSVNGVQALFGRLWNLGGDVRRLGHTRLAAIGPATAAALEKFGLRADLVPAEYRGEALAAALSPLVAGKQVLWVRANRGRDVLPTALTNAGARFESVVVYENHDIDQLSDADRTAFESGAVDWVAVSSPSIARNFARLLTPAGEARLGSPTRIAAISPVTAEATRAAGLPVDVVASEFTWDGLLLAIAQAPGNLNAGRGLLDSGVRAGDVSST